MFNEVIDGSRPHIPQHHYLSNIHQKEFSCQMPFSVAKLISNFNEISVWIYFFVSNIIKTKMFSPHFMPHYFIIVAFCWPIKTICPIWRSQTSRKLTVSKYSVSEIFCFVVCVLSHIKLVKMRKIGPFWRPFNQFIGPFIWWQFAELFD